MNNLLQKECFDQSFIKSLFLFISNYDDLYYNEPINKFEQ